MIDPKSSLVVIPARGGSRRLLKKNILPFCGKPLISWTIELALKIPNVYNVIVSTEDREVATISESYGAKVPFRRPYKLSQNEVSATEVMKHAVNEVKFKGNVILLQPTSPLRKMEDIQKGLSLVKNNLAVMSVKKYIHNSSLCTYSKPGEKFVPINTSGKDMYVPNGAVYVANSNWLLKNHTFYTNKVALFEMPQERSIDIDYEFQFLIAEKIFKFNNIG